MKNQFEQEIPIRMKVFDELAKTSSYDSSISLCKQYLSEIESITKRRLIAYFAAPLNKMEAFINDDDPVYIEDLLRLPSRYSGLDLIINSAGGSALAAERIINVCKNYVMRRNNEEFRVIVPKIAKSAATIVALGADRIILCENAELGPIDPQIFIQIPGGTSIIKPACLIVKAVMDLTTNAKSIFRSRNQRYTTFLKQYNYELYTMAKNEIELSKNIIDKIIKNKESKFFDLTHEDFKIFTDPAITLSHNRLICIEDLRDKKIYNSGFISDINYYFLEINEPRLKHQEIERINNLIWELYIRKDMLLKDSANPQIKTIEDSNWPFIIGDPDWKAPQKTE